MSVLGSFGAARHAAHSTGSPVVVATSEVDEHGQPFVRIHEALHPADFESPKALLDEMLARHEPVILAWPEGVDIPLSALGPGHDLDRPDRSHTREGGEMTLTHERTEDRSDDLPPVEAGPEESPDSPDALPRRR